MIDKENLKHRIFWKPSIMENISDEVLFEIIEEINNSEETKIVKCKDCKFYKANSDLALPYCTKGYKLLQDGDWFCAGGIERDE